MSGTLRHGGLISARVSAANHAFSARLLAVSLLCITYAKAMELVSLLCITYAEAMEMINTAADR